MSHHVNKSIKTGDVTGSGIAIGDRAQAQVTITQQNQNEILGLLEKLRKEISSAGIPDTAKNVLLNKTVPAMTEAMNSHDPKSGVKHGLERINDQLEGVGAAASNVSGIIETVSKIAKYAGIAIKNVAPFLATLI